MLIQGIYHPHNNNNNTLANILALIWLASCIGDAENDAYSSTALVVNCFGWDHQIHFNEKHSKSKLDWSK